MYSTLNACILFIFQLVNFRHIHCQDFPTKTFVSNGTVFHLRPSNRDAYKNVPIFIADTSGLKYIGNPKRSEEVCEDLDKGASFLPNIKCPFKDKCDGVCFFGVHGTTETQTIFDSNKYNINQIQRGNMLRINNSRTGRSEMDFDYYDYAYSSLADKARNYRMEKTSKKKLDILYPKLLIIVDFTLFEKINKYIRSVDQYMNIFWNAVDQTYLKLKDPQIKLKIVGLVIEKKRNSLHYLANNTDYGQNRLYMRNALHECIQLKSSNYMNPRGRSLPKYDGIITMTSLVDFMSPTKGRAGIARRGIFCSTTFISCGIIYDDGHNFTGIRTATHELGHMLGLYHDGYNKNNKGLTYEQCDSKYYEGRNIHTVMAPFSERSYKEYEWSSCSKQALQALRESEALQCLGKP